MKNDLLIAVIAGLGGMSGWGLADFFAKKTIDRLGDVETLFWGQLIGIVPLTVLFVLRPEIPDITGLQWLLVVVLGLWSGLSYVPTYVAFGKGQVSLLSPLFASYAVIVAIASALLFGESIPTARVGAFAVVFIGVVLISGDPRGLWHLIGGGRRREAVFQVRGFKEIVLAIGLYSAWLLVLDQFIAGRYWVPILLGIRVFSAVAIFGYVRALGRSLAVRDRSLWNFLIAIGCCDVAAFASVSFGFSATALVSVVAMLSGAFSLPTIVLARIFLKEHATAVQTVGSIVVIAGIMLLALV